MKKVILFLAIMTGCIGLTACQDNATKDSKTTKNMAKYDFISSACAPNLYPAEIIQGDFYLEDGSSLYIPTGAFLKNGWGGLGQTHVSGPDRKAIPVSLDITWVSYLEKKYYTGNFALPREQIAKYFEEGFFDVKTGKRGTYHWVVAGVAPGGVVVVWLVGTNKNVEIGRYKAEETTVEKEDFMPYAELSVSEILDRRVKRFLEKNNKPAEFVDSIPYGIWDTYRIKYNWRPQFNFKTNSEIESMIIEYYNGEEIYSSYEDFELTIDKEKAIPKYIGLQWKDSDTNNKFGCKIYLAEQEIFSAYKKLGVDSNLNPLRLLINVDKYHSELTLTLENNKDTEQLVKQKVTIYTRE
ncbi:DUF2931 family protein [Zobellia laminariae]|uniref:DUF2931 family protein n=1 Tax=Zobellia laminariae TaxID=248906 RepID=UPI003EF38536